MSRILEELTAGALLSRKGAATFCAIASDVCGTQSAGMYRLGLQSGAVTRLDKATDTLDQRITGALLEKAYRQEGATSGQGLLITRVWPWEPAEQVKSAVFIVVQAPPQIAKFSFTQVDRRRLTTLTAFVGLREAAHEQAKAELLLRRGTRSMAATAQVDRRLADIADAISEASGADHVAIWLSSPANRNVFRLRAVKGGPKPADLGEQLAASQVVQRDLLGLAQGRVAVVAMSAVQWLPEIFGSPADALGDSVLTIPVRRAGDVVGIATGVPAADSSQELIDVGQPAAASLLEALADQIALATEFAHTAQDAQQSARRFALLAAVADVALAKMGATEMIDAILTRVRDHFEGDKAALYLLHGDRGALGTRSVQREGSAGGKVYSLRVPVAWNDQLIGSLVLRRVERPFDESEEETLVLVAEQVALAVSTSGRYEFQAAMAVLDMLTDLPNRRSAEATLDRELAHAATSSDGLLGVALLDIDHFKAVNDTYGHETGDAVLSELAGMFKAQLRGTDFIARWGGEEFLLLYRGTDTSRMHQTGERVRRAAAMISPKSLDGTKFTVTVSLGGAVCPTNGTSRDVLVAAADAALYEAKDQGRNRSVWAAPSSSDVPLE
jgi:diguanylate cyclase (GGDEF)-like protein